VVTSVFSPELKTALQGRKFNINTIQAKPQDALAVFQTMHFPERFKW
jgi:hypothetical protein